MNEFEFYGSEFLDSFSSPQLYSSDVPGLEASAALTPNSSNAASVTSTAYPDPTSTAGVAQSQSFPPNFYADITYETSPANGAGTKTETESKCDVERKKAQVEEIAAASHDSPQESQVDAPEIDITINNVVCSFAVRCHLNLRKIATEGMNVIYKRENGVGVHSFLVCWSLFKEDGKCSSCPSGDGRIKCLCFVEDGEHEAS